MFLSRILPVVFALFFGSAVNANHGPYLDIFFLCDIPEFEITHVEQADLLLVNKDTGAAERISLDRLEDFVRPRHLHQHKISGPNDVGFFLTGGDKLNMQLNLDLLLRWKSRTQEFTETQWSSKYEVSVRVPSEFQGTAHPQVTMLFYLDQNGNLKVITKFGQKSLAQMLLAKMSAVRQ